MNKAELISKLRRSVGGLPSKDYVETFIDCFTDEIKKSVARGDDVSIRGFGVFTKSKYRSRIGRNPQTGIKIEIEAAFHPKFRASKQFKAEIN